MAALPYIQLYVADYITDTMHLTTAQHGAYLLLIMNYWQRGKALVDCNDRLAAICRMSKREWLKARPILEEFFTVMDGHWYHKRIEEDLTKIHARSVAGKTGAQALAAKKRQKLTKSIDLIPCDLSTKPEANNELNECDRLAIANESHDNRISDLNANKERSHLHKDIDKEKAKPLKSPPLNPENLALMPPDGKSNPKTRGRKKAQTLPFPENFIVTDEHRELAKKYGKDADEERIGFELYCKSNGKEYTDYDAAFKNRLMKIFTNEKPPPKKINRQYETQHYEGSTVIGM